MNVKNLNEIDENVTPEEYLWRAVLTQALTDALSGEKNRKFDRDEALEWIKKGLNKNSRNFVEVCYMSGLNIDYVRRVYRTELRKAGLL